MTSNQLTLAPDFGLPLEAVTETFAILAKRGAGKTNTAVVMAEELLAARQQVVIVDPVGVWWGLRAQADGSPSTLPIVIVGGDHADLPLDEASGRALAVLLVSHRQSAVLDLSELSKSASRRLMADFLEELYRVNRAPMHLIVDEADLLAPQRLPREMTRLLGAMDDVVRRGRAHGLGSTLISQRPAVLNKDVLGQAEVLVALRMTSPRDVAAIDEWIRLHADPEQAAVLKESLPALPVGTAWVWSPGWLEVLQRVEVRARATFDSSATPSPNRVAVRPDLARVDVQVLRDELRQQLETPAGGVAAKRKTTVPPDRSQEVAALQSTVDQLQRDLAAARDQPAREVPVLSPADRAAMVELRGQVQQLTQAVDHVLERVPNTSNGFQDQGQRPSRSAKGNEAKRPAPPAARSAAASREPDRPFGQPPPGARRMLQAMADHHPAHLSRAQVATLAQMKSRSGTFGTYLSRLRTQGLVDEDEAKLLFLTSEGVAAAGAEVRPPRTAADVQDQWRQALGAAGARRLFDYLLEAYPKGVERTDLAAAADLKPRSGTFGTYLSRLRSNNLVTVEHGIVRATDVLFLDP